MIAFYDNSVLFLQQQEVNRDRRIGQILPIVVQGGLWALGMAQIGGDEKTGVRALSLLVRCPKACGIALLKPNEQRRPHADMVYIDNVLPHRYSRTRAYVIPVSVYRRTSLV